MCKVSFVTTAVGPRGKPVGFSKRNTWQQARRENSHGVAKERRAHAWPTCSSQPVLRACSIPKLALSLTIALSVMAVHAGPAVACAIKDTAAAQMVLADASTQRHADPGKAAVLVMRRTHTIDSNAERGIDPIEDSETGAELGTKAHVSKGERVATYLRRAGVPDALIVLIVSALPVVELRAGIPVGYLLGLPGWKTFCLAVCGNLLPILPTLLVLRISFVQAISQRFLTRAQHVAKGIGTASSRTTALALFVGVPLPGTGAWTGALVAFCVGMSTRHAFVALAAGVVMAAIVMTALCELGWLGAWIAGAVLGFTGIAAMVRALRGGDPAVGAGSE